MTITYAQAVTAIKQNAEYTIYEDDLDTIVWHDDNPTNITKAQILAKQTELQDAFNAKQSQRGRVYPKIGDQLDMLWHSIDQNPALKSQYFDFYEAIKAVKVKNPK